VTVTEQTFSYVVLKIVFKNKQQLFLQLMYGSLYFLSLKDTGLKLWKSMIFDLAVEKKL